MREGCWEKEAFSEISGLVLVGGAAMTIQQRQPRKSPHKAADLPLQNRD